MTRAGIVVVAGLIVGVVAATMPAAAVAEPRQHHRARLGPDGSPHRDRHALRHRHHTPRHRHHSPRPFVTFYSVPSVVYYTYYSPPVYYAPPVVYQAPPVYVPAPAMSRVVEYPTGRYELRGDGVVTPYEWAWIPNPPAAPPAPVEPATVTPERTAAVVTPSGPREAFRWTDDHGVTTWTDRLDNVPERYRARVQRLH
jgi:hypothetical protein